MVVKRLECEGVEGTVVDVINDFFGEKSAFDLDSFLGVGGEELLLLFDAGW